MYKRKLEELNQLVSCLALLGKWQKELTRQKGIKGASLDPRIQALKSAERSTPHPALAPAVAAAPPDKPVTALQAMKDLMSPLTVCPPNYDSSTYS